MTRKKDAFAELEARTDYVFKDRALVMQALTHASYLPGGADNQRLEFLGDRVLGLIVAEQFYDLDPEAHEGTLTLQLNALVCKPACARAAQRAGLGVALRMSPAETAQGGRERENILGDACEAFIAALYLDGGMEAARDFVLRFWGEAFSEARDFSGESLADPKSRLQDWALKRGYDLPVYSVIKRTGPDHAPCFYVEVAVQDDHTAQGKAASKRAAERQAAQALLKHLDP